MDLAEFGALLSDLAISVHEESKSALEKSAVLVEHEAKKVIGEYQGDAGPFAAWITLADATQASRAVTGYPPNEPLLVTGDLRDGIEHRVEIDGFSGTAHVGSDSDIALYQELGTPDGKHPIPARSFLGGSLFRKADEVKDLIGGSVYGALIGHPTKKIPIIE